MTSIEWLMNELKKERIIRTDLKTTIALLTNKAKEMHKQEITTSYRVGACEVDKIGEYKADKYYQETFVSKGSGAIELPKQEKSEKPINLEISDEEIEKSANYYYPLLGEQSKKALWINGCKWYREKLKQNL